MPYLRVFDRITKQHQRLGYLKRLIKKVTSLSTSSLDNLGNDLVDTVMRKVKVPLTDDLVHYIKIRLFDRAYKTLKEQTDTWTKSGGEAPIVQVEIQDLYLADPSLPSAVGKLVKDDWRYYPPFGTNLGLIRSGTYSANTRALTLLYFTSEEEHRAFIDYLPEFNPFRVNSKQALLFLYSMIENDGEVIIPLIRKLIEQQITSFNDREVGNLLPEIYQTVIERYRKGMLSYDLRDRLETLEKSAKNIGAQRLKENYEGGSSREHAARPRLEPYVDIGLFSKSNPMKYEYSFSPVGLRWAAAFSGQEDSAAVEQFLSRRFFQTAAVAWDIAAAPLFTPEEIVSRLKRSAKAISSSSGYAPIEEMALLAGIEALVDDHQIIEIGAAREALIAFQKANPYQVRFTVDRMGTLAHAKFIDEVAPRPS